MKKFIATLAFALFLSTNLFAGTPAVQNPVSDFITVKVVDANGKTIFTQEISINEFLETQHQVQGLPEGSLFLLYQGNTAYYLVTDAV